MAKSFRPKRNFTAKSDVFIGKPYEVTLDCERQELRIHDGITAGGIPTARNVDLKQSTRVSHTQYAVGDTVACPKRAGVYLVCASAGKTSSSDLGFANAVPGSIVVDGTVSWIVTVPFVSNVNGIYPDADGRVNVSFVSSVNGVEPDPAGDVSLKDSDIEKILGYTPLQKAPVTSVDGKKGDVNLSLTYQPKGNYVKSVNGSVADASGNVTVDGSSAYQIPFASCSTATNKEEKVATVTNGVPLNLVAGAMVAIKFTAALDVYTFATLNVNSLGAKAVKLSSVSLTVAGSMNHNLSIGHSNNLYVFVYDGTYWNMVTTYGSDSYYFEDDGD